MTGGESSSLRGRTFLVTRTHDGNIAERRKLEERGAKVIELPLIEVRPPTDQSKIDDAIARISEFDWIVFTSANGVNRFFERFKEKGGREEQTQNVKFACVGSATERALQDLGFKATLVPSEFRTLKLGEEMASRFEIRRKQVLLARAEEANREIIDVLERWGAVVTEAPVYSTVPRRALDSSDERVLDQVTDITLTSSSTVKGLILNFDPEEIKLRRIKVHCIGPVTAESALKAGLDVSSTSSIYTIDGLIDTITTGSTSNDINR